MKPDDPKNVHNYHVPHSIPPDQITHVPALPNRPTLPQNQKITNKLPISAISYMLNNIKYYVISNSIMNITIKEDTTAKRIGRSTIANTLNTMLYIKEINEKNLYEWLNQHVPLSKTHTIKLS